jgi:hypothetical protein
VPAGSHEDLLKIRLPNAECRHAPCQLSLPARVQPAEGRIRLRAHFSPAPALPWPGARRMEGREGAFRERKAGKEKSRTTGPAFSHTHT